MPTRFARRRKRRSSTAKATAGEPIAAASSAPTTASSGNLEEILTKAYNFVVSNNDRVRGRILSVKSSGNRVYAVTDDRYLSNALYHALRALGRNRVRRWSEGGKWIIAYS
jgi:hypothetical protein